MIITIQVTPFTLPPEYEILVTMNSAVHFVGFRGDEFHSAVRVFGKPDFYHRVWDFRAQQECGSSDVVVFSSRVRNVSEPSVYSFDDSAVF